MKTLIYLLIVLSFSISLVRPVSGQSPVIIDVDKALENQKNIKLSQFIDHAEMIELEGKRGAYIQGLYWAHVGAKYIMVGDKQPGVILLFTREGKFLRQIGSVGEGPGEYTTLNAAAMSPDEKCIIIGDFGSRKLISYNPDGKLLKEITLKDGAPSRLIDEICFIDNLTFAVQFRKPVVAVDNYNRIQFYTTGLEPLNTL